MDNELMINAEPASMSPTATLSTDAGVMELCDDELDTVAGGCGGDGFNQSSGNFFSQKNLAMNQATFAGPQGSGTVSSITLEEISSGAFQNLSGQV